MKLRWCGTAAVMLESDGYRIVFDPFLGMPLARKPFERERLTAVFRTADAVLVTHGHFDHNHDIPELYHNSDIEIYATDTPCKTLRAHGVDPDKLRLIAPGDSLALNGFRIQVYQGRHCRFDLGVVKQTLCKADTLRHPKRLLELWRLNKQYDENGETLFFEIEAEGKRIQLMGSMGMDLSTEYPSSADALILPFQGTGDPSATVAPIVDKLQPRRIYLDHYDDAFPPLSSQIATSGFVGRMFRQGIPCVAMKQGREYII